MAFFRNKYVFSLMAIPTIWDAVVQACTEGMKRLLLAAVTCILAIGGSVLGATMGAIRGQFTEAGFLDGAGKGTVTGAIAAIQLLELDFSDDDESFPKVAVLGRLVLGKTFMECIYLTVAKAYEWNIVTETTFEDISDAYETCGVTGLSDSLIKTLPIHHFNSSNMSISYIDLCCSICLQDLNEGDLARELPTCGHCFHLHCIDVWLTRRRSCPLCRSDIFSETND